MMNSKRGIIQAFALLTLLAGMMLGFVFYTAASAAENAPLEVLWSEDFEEYTPGTTYTEAFPSANWTHSGLKDAFVYTDTENPGNQFLRTHGVPGDCLGSVAYRDIGYYAHVEIEFDVNNEIPNEYIPLTGCHKKIAGLELSTAPTWEASHRGLLAFSYNDTVTPHSFQIRGGAFEIDEGLGSYLQDFSLNEWYHVRVVYDYNLATDEVILSYYIDGALKHTETFVAKSYEMLLDNIGLWVGQGRAEFDNVTVSASEPIDVSQLFQNVYLPLVTNN